MVGGEVLDEHEGHAALRRHLREELLERLQAARGRAHAHNETARVRPPLRARRLGLRRSLWILGRLVVHSLFCLQKMPLYEFGDSDLHRRLSRTRSEPAGVLRLPVWQNIYQNTIANSTPPLAGSVAHWHF